MSTENKTITIVPRYGLQQGAIYVEPVYDTYTGLYRGIPHNWEELRKQGRTCATPNDSFKFDFPAGKPYVFNLANDNIAQMWDWIKETPQVAETKEDMVGDGSKLQALAYVEDAEGELKKEASVKKKKFELEAWVRSLPYPSQIEKCKLLGQHTQYMKPIDVEDYLIEKARSAKYLELEAIKNEKNDKTRLFLIELKERKIIQSYHGGFKFGEQVMGTDLQSTIYWLNQPENRDVVMMWKRQLNMGFEGEGFSLESELVKEKNKGGRPSLNKPVETVVENA